jgi:3-methylcrotonyl-CoA carboxylase beta subunit
VSAEELGGAELHCSTSGVTDHLAESEAHAISIARGIVGNLHNAGAPPTGRREEDDSWEEPLHSPEELRGVTPIHCF